MKQSNSVNESTKPFVVAVNEAGLPHGWCPLDTSDEANVLGLRAQEVSKIYWMLKKLEISYAYSVNGKRVERNFSIKPAETPRDRIATSAKFFENSDKSVSEGSKRNDGRDYWVGFDSSKVFQSKEKSKFDMHFDIYEEDEYQNFILTTGNREGYRKVGERNFSFSGRELSLKLWCEPADWNGLIEYVEVKEEFY